MLLVSYGMPFNIGYYVPEAEPGCAVMLAVIDLFPRIPLSPRTTSSAWPGLGLGTSAPSCGISTAHTSTLGSVPSSTGRGVCSNEIPTVTAVVICL